MLAPLQSPFRASFRLQILEYHAVSVALRHEHWHLPRPVMLFVAKADPICAESELFSVGKPRPPKKAGKLARTLQRLTSYTFPTRRIVMLYWAAVFFVIALLAAIFGFGGLAASAAGVAKILFFVFLIFAVVSFLFGRRSPA